MSVTRMQVVVEANRRVMRQVELPLRPSVWAMLTLPHPLTDVEWEQMLTILAVMRPALTGVVDEPAPEESRAVNVAPQLAGKDEANS